MCVLMKAAAVADAVDAQDLRCCNGDSWQGGHGREQVRSSWVPVVSKPELAGASGQGQQGSSSSRS